MGDTISLKVAKDVNKVDGTTAPVKNKKAATDKKTAKAIKEKVAKARDVMYRYNEESSDGPGKKKFRAKARKVLAKFTKKLKKAAAADKPAILARAEKWAKKTYTKEHQPKFA